MENKGYVFPFLKDIEGNDVEDIFLRPGMQLSFSINT